MEGIKNHLLEKLEFDKKFENVKKELNNEVIPKLEKFKLTRSHEICSKCLLSCSDWILNLNAKTNRTCDQFSVRGKIINNSDENYQKFYQKIKNSNFIENLPIESVIAQQLVLDKKQEKINFKIEFELTKSDKFNQSNSLTTIFKDYSNINFEIFMNSVVHNIRLLDRDINFTLKGYDIVKSISQKITDLIVNKNSFSNSYNNFSSPYVILKPSLGYIAQIFTNPQCSVSVEFCASSKNLKFDKLSNNYNNLLNSDIKITKLFIDYNIPAFMFSRQKNTFKTPRPKSGEVFCNTNKQYSGVENSYNNCQTFLPFMHNQHLTFRPELSNINLQNKYSVTNLMPNSNFMKPQIIINPGILKTSEKFPPRNPMCNLYFCNWHNFMTCTTPFLYENDSVTILDFFKNFEKASAMGIECIFSSGKINNIKHIYFPSLSSLFIEFNSTKEKETNLNQNNITGDLNSTLESSFFSHTSYTSYEEGGFVIKHYINFQEEQEVWNRELIYDKVKEIFKTDSELEDVNLSEISADSYFSILWTEKNNIHPFAQMTTPSFLIFYKFKNSKKLNNTIQFVPIIGLISNKLSDEAFWFKGSSIMSDSFILNSNKFFYNSFVSSAHHFVNYNKINDNIDYKNLTNLG
jgi:hypothetical protein